MKTNDSILRVKGRATSLAAAIVVAVSTLGSSAGLHQLRASALDEWTWRNPYPHGLDLYESAYGNGRFVSVGDRITMSSVDGVNWDVRRPGATFYGITFAANRFVAVGSFGDVGISADGENWGIIQPPTFNLLFGIAFGNNIFVAVGIAGTVIASPDATNWTIRASGTSRELGAVAFGNGRFVAVGDSGTILVSSNGVNWSARASETTQYLYEIHYANDQFVAVGVGGVIRTSPDGSIWTPRTSGTSLVLGTVTFGNGLYLAAGQNGVLLSSSDAVTWSPQTSGTTAGIEHIVFGDGRFLAVGDRGTILASTNGTNWTSQQRRVTSSQLWSVTRGDSVWVAVGQFPTVLVSTNGREWTLADSGISEILWGVAAGGGQFVAVGGFSTRGVILSSSNGVNWTLQSSNAFSALNAVTYGNGTFVAVGNNATIANSTNGVQWTRAGAGSGFSLNALTYGAGLFVAVGTRGNVLVSPDGRDWTNRSLGTNENLVSISYGNGLFVAAADFGRPYVSSNAITWTPQNTLGFGGLSLAFGAGTFVAASNNKIYSSTNGVNWRQHFPGIDATPYDVTYGDGSFLGVGDNGIIVQSGFLTPRLPTVVDCPRSQTVVAGEDAVFRIRIADTTVLPITYEWRHNGVTITQSVQNAYVSQLVLVNAGTNRAGDYTVRVSNTNGTALNPCSSALLRVLPDTDGDRMPDEWEIAYGLNSTNANDALLDADGDLMKNVDEYRAGTNPMIALSVLKLSVENDELFGLGLVIFMNAAAHKSYTLQQRSSLTSGSWSNIFNIDPLPNDEPLGIGIGPVEPAVPSVYYRVVTPAQP